MARSTADNLQVLYEDNHLLAVNKRPGDIVQGDKTGDVPLSEIVKSWLRVKYNKPGNVFTGVVHRIDRPVSGVVVFAKTSKALSRLNETFKSRDVKKTYWACVSPEPAEASATLIDYMYKDEAANKSRVTRPGNKAAKMAELSYSIMARADRYTLLEVRPLTGRHHQIRVQLSHAGFPIKGDLKYGSPRSNPDGSIHLHARAVEFTHPVSGADLRIVAPPPAEDPLWSHFSRIFAK